MFQALTVLHMNIITSSTLRIENETHYLYVDGFCTRTRTIYTTNSEYFCYKNKFVLIILEMF
jgi:hypothetical protein